MGLLGMEERVSHLEERSRWNPSRGTERCSSGVTVAA